VAPFGYITLCCVNSQKHFRVQLRFEATDLLALKIYLPSVVDANVFALGLAAVNFMDVKEEDATVGLDHQAQGRAGRLSVLTVDS
jgi:hypothetical protein